MPGKFWDTVKSSLGTNRAPVSPMTHVENPLAPPSSRQIASGQSPQEMRASHARGISTPTTSHSELRASHVGRPPFQGSGSQPDLRTVLQGKAKIQREGFVPLTPSKSHQVQTAPTASQHFIMSQDKHAETRHDTWRASAKGPAKPHGSKVEDLSAAKTDRVINGAPLHEREAAKVGRADLQDSGYKNALRASSVAEKIEGVAEVVDTAADLMVKGSFLAGSPHVAATVATANGLTQTVLRGTSAGMHAKGAGLAKGKLGEDKAGDSREAAINRGHANTGLGSEGTRSQFASDFIKAENSAAKREGSAAALALLQGAVASTGMEWTGKGMEGVVTYASSRGSVAEGAVKATYETQQAMGNLASNVANAPGEQLHKDGKAITREGTGAPSHDLVGHFSSPEGRPADQGEEVGTRFGEAVVDDATGKTIDKVSGGANGEVDSRPRTSSKAEKGRSTGAPPQATRSPGAERLAQMKPPTTPPPKQSPAHQASSSAIELGQQKGAERSAEKVSEQANNHKPGMRKQAWPERPSTR